MGPSVNIVACKSRQVVDTRLNLDKVVVEKNLGLIASNQLLTIVQVINTKNENANLSLDDVEFDGNPSEISATIKAKVDSKKFVGQVIVVFMLIKDLGKLDKNLGTFKIQPDAQMILARFNKKNGVLNQDVTIENIGKAKALIRVQSQSTLVVGTLEVFFEVYLLKTQPTRYIDKDEKKQSTKEKNLNSIKEEIK